MNFKSLTVITLLIFSSISIFATVGGKKNKKATDDISFIEANVLIGSGDCGYLLQLANGVILKPSTEIPKKLRDNHLKVLVKFEDLNTFVEGNTCNATKVISIIEIKKYKNTSHIKAKY